MYKLVMDITHIGTVDHISRPYLKGTCHLHSENDGEIKTNSTIFFGGTLFDFFHLLYIITT